MIQDIVKLIVRTPPSEEPVTLAEAKAHLRVDYTADDDLISALIIAARQYCEAATKRAFVNTTFEYRLSYLPLVLTLPRAPLISVSSITYLDYGGNRQTLGTSIYQVSEGSPGRIYHAYNHYFYPIRRIIDSVQIRFVAGYGAAADVPEIAKTAIKSMVAHLYENREATSEVALSEVPFAVDALLGTLDWGFQP